MVGISVRHYIKDIVRISSRRSFLKFHKIKLLHTHTQTRTHNVTVIKLNFTDTDATKLQQTIT